MSRYFSFSCFLFPLTLFICLSQSCIGSSSVANTLLLYRDVCNVIIIFPVKTVFGAPGGWRVVSSDVRRNCPVGMHLSIFGAAGAAAYFRVCSACLLPASATGNRHDFLSRSTLLELDSGPRRNNACHL